MSSETFDVTNPAKPSIKKDPNAILDYTWDWTTWLLDASNPTDTISSHTINIVAPAEGVTVQSSSITGASKMVTAWLAGGTAGKTVQVTCRIVTAGGRTEDRSIYLKIKER